MPAARVTFAVSTRHIVRFPPLVVALFVAVLTLGQGSFARAENVRETARLAYSVAGNAAGCPDEESFRNLVTARLGYDPFEPDGKHVAVVEITREAGRLRVQARVTRQGQREPGVRELTGGLGQCEALTSALATAVAIALDPVRGMQGPAAVVPPPQAPSPPQAPPPQALPPAVAPPLVEEASPARPIVASTPPARSSAPPLPPPLPSPPPSYRVSFFAAAGGLVSVAAAPTVTLGGELGAGLRVRAFSLEAALRAETTPGSSLLSSGERVDVTLITAGLFPCGHLGGWFGCALFRGGAVQGRALDVLAPLRKTSPFAAAGLRAGYALQIAGPVAVRAAIEAALPLTRTALIIDHFPVWTAPMVSGGVDLGVLVAFQ